MPYDTLPTLIKRAYPLSWEKQKLWLDQLMEIRALPEAKPR